MRIVLRRLAEARAFALGLAVLVLVTAFVAALGPLVLGRASDTTLQQAIAAAPVDVRNLQLLVRGRIWPTGGDPLGTVTATGEELEARVPTSVRDLVAERDIVVDTSRWVVTSRHVEERTLRLRVQPGAAQRVRIVEGRMPAGLATAATGPVTASGAAPVPVVEVALPVESARSLGTHVGEILQLGLDGTNLSSFLDLASVGIDVVGIYEVPEPRDPYWFSDALLAGPSIRSLSQLAQVQDLTALVAPAAYPALLSALAHGPPLTYAWRLTLDPDRLVADRIDEIQAGLRRLESIFPSSTPRVTQQADPTAGAALRTGLLGIIETEQAQWASVMAVLTTTAIGTAGIAATALALVAVLAAGRRRSSLAAWRARGASRGQVLAALVAEGAVLAVPTAAMAALAAVILVPDGPADLGIGLAAGVGLVAVVLLVVTAPNTGPEEATRYRRPEVRRLVFEGLLVSLAIIGGILLRERGVRGGGASSTLTAADPFVAAVPALFGLAAGIVAVRVFPLLMGLLARIAARRRDLVPVLALRRLTRGAGNGAILLVLLATTAIGTFSSITLLYFDQAAEAIAWSDVGAPYRLDAASGGPMPSLLDPATLPGVAATAGAFSAQEAITGRGTRLRLLALDAADYASLTSGSAAYPTFPSEFGDSGTTGAGGTAGSAVTNTPVFPAIVSTDLAGEPTRLADGTTFRITMQGSRSALGVSFRTVQVRSAFPGLAAGASFVVVSRDQLRTALPDLQVPTTTLYVAAAPDDAAALRDAVAARVPGQAIVVRDRAAEVAELRASPYVGTVTAGVAFAAALAAAYALLAITAGFALTGAARAREVAHLRALGLPGDRTFGLVLVEHGPTVGLAVVAGAVLGAGLFALLQPGLGLAAIVGSAAEVPILIDAPILGLIVVATVAIVAAGMAIATAIERRSAPALALRRGIE